MQMRAGECGDDFAEALSDADDTLLRIFTVEENASLAPGADAGGRWISSDSETARQFSAVAWSFSRQLRAFLNCPIGVVVAAWGGTQIEAWTSRRALLSTPWRERFLASETDACSSTWWERHAREADAKGLLSCYPADIGKPEENPAEARCDFDDSAWRETAVPGYWSKNELGPLGVVWYRRWVELPPHWRGRELSLDLGIADKHDATFVNGVLIGSTGKGLDASPWNTRRSYSVPSHLTGGPRLLIAVRVFSFSGDGGLGGPSEFMQLALKEAAETEAAIPLDGTWHCCQTMHLPVCHDLYLPGHLNPNTPSILYNNMIAPLAPFPFRGVLWYQGEQNLSRADEYETLLCTMIRDWRAEWGIPNLPFLVVQLPLFGTASAYEDASNWAALRNAQRRAAERTPDCHLIASLDLGDPNDIHPRQKAELGRRLAHRALSAVYKRSTEAPSAQALSASQSEDTLIVYLSDKLAAASAPVALYLENSPGEWVRTEAKVVGNQLRIAPAPRALRVRHAWSDHPTDSIPRTANGEPLPTFELFVSSPRIASFSENANA
jgi:sialate O-acetylesterase